MFFQNLAQKIWKQRYALSLLAVWTVLIFFSAVWNIHENYRGTYSKALIEAETIFQHNLAYRRWNSMHGGVYAKVSEINPPNPYIIVGQRDIIAKDGSEYTMINPFQMTKQAYDLLKKQSPDLAVYNRTVSLDPLNSENLPDEWETKALEGFDNGKGATSEITTINGLPYMRMISPYITEARCLGCHEHQGYDIGDIRGGMSISVPMQPYYDAAASVKEIIVMTHMLLWMLGAVTITLLFVGLNRYQMRITKDEEKFRIVSEFAYNFEYWVNQNKKIAFISPSCKRVTGYSRKEFLRKSHMFFDMIHPDDKGMFKNHLKEFDEPVHEDMEYRIITKNGDVRWLSHVCSPIYVDGEFRGRRGSNRDITENKRLEEDLIQAKKVESLGHFAGGVAHDFNNVLTSISTITQLLKGKIDKESTTLHEYINYITVASKLGQNMTSNLLQFGRKRTTNLEASKLNEIITNIDNILRVLLTDEIDYAVSLTDKEEFVMADPHQVEQVLINLATNARDAMPNGGQLAIETSAVSFQENQEGKFGDIPAGDYMTLSVSDTGSGINDTDMATIFEPFYSTKASTKGTGLGLSIVDNIIKQHNAFIDIDSTLNEGTTFRIFFPTCLEGDDDSSSVVLEESSKGERGTILVVDDDWLIRKSLLIFLQGLGYSVLLAVDGDEALNKYRANRELIRLVVLDVMLPKKDGREVYDTLKAQDEDVSVLFVSGSTREVLAEKKILRDDVNFLAKPLEMKVFGEKIQEILQKDRRAV
jgi:PAS domain S-box-containing protein